jgi:hypothetical protein
LQVFAFRASKELRSDPRRDKHGNSLRQAIDVSFLNPRPSAQVEVLYEAVTSCVAAGADDRHWDAHLLVDTYHDGSDAIRETIWGYHADNIDTDGVKVDPLLRGELNADMPEWDPRRYFFYVLESRVNLAKLEWSRSVDHVKSSFERFQRVSMRTNLRPVLRVCI